LEKRIVIWAPEIAAQYQVLRGAEARMISSNGGAAILPRVRNVGKAAGEAWWSARLGACGLVALLRRLLSLCLVRTVSEEESKKKLMARRMLN
jgi:hypothetical protein